MKVRKAIKKIAALGLGATMMGMTLGGAMAADLSEYPAMFIDDGQFNGILVIGKEADAIDTLGVTNVALGLQAAAVSQTTVCTGSTSTTTVVDDGVKIEKSSTDFELGNDIEDIKSTLDDQDLPGVLADGNYNENKGDNKNDVDYTQILEMQDGAAVFGYYQDDDLAEEAGPYLYFPKGDVVYSYVLEFDSPVEHGTSSADVAEDLESTTLKIQGQTYTITDAAQDGAGVVDKLTLMVGDTIMWMTQDQEVVKTVDGVDHTIKMIDVTSDADACGFEIDGSTVWIDVDDTETVSGITLGVTDAKAVHTEKYDADICQVNLGAAELILEDGQELDKDGDEVDGSEVTLSSADASSAGSWTGITLTWTPEDDAVYLAPGDELVDPVFGNFKFIFGGVVAEYEEISHSASGDEATISFTNTAGKLIEIPLIALDGTDADTDLDYTILGDGDGIDEKIYYPGAAECDGTATDVTDCEGARWLIEVDGEAHILELTNIDIEDKLIDFKDLTDDVVDSDNSYTHEDGTIDTIYIAGIGNIGVAVDSNDTIELSSIGAMTSIETEFGATIAAFTEGTGNDSTTISWTENDEADTPRTIVVEFTVDTDDEEIRISAPTAGGWNADALPVDSDNDDDVIYVTDDYGSKVTYDSDNDDELIIYHPEETVIADVYVAPTGAAVTVSEGAGEGCQVYETVNKIPASVNKFDTDVTNPTAQNVISVGGPCANAVTSALLGNPEVCYEGFEAGKAMLKLVETGDKVALVIAGGTGDDTWRASKIMQNYDQYALSGKQMVATTVSESSLSVTAYTAN